MTDKRPAPPNILLIMTDQQRWDTVAALGNATLRTPALDRLVREGTAFTNCYTPSPVCVSARCALLTGLAPHVTGCVDNMPMSQERPSFMERLQALGYQTHGVGKMHFTPDAYKLWGFESRDISEEISPLDGDADHFRRFLREHGYGHVDEPHGVRSEMYYIPQPSQLPAHLHHTNWVADRALDFLQRRDPNRPFLLWASFIKPHPPFEAPTPWNKLYRAAEMAPAFRPEGYPELLTYWNRVQNRYKYRDHGYDELLVRAMRALYYACISFIDHQVGRILEGLGSEAANTLVVFTSDHGELLGDYGSFGKRTMLDAAARVPLLVRWPDVVEAGRICPTPASLVDLWPTFLWAAGAEESSASDEGVNLTSLAEGRHADRTVYSQFQQERLGVYMAVDRAWKYVYSAPDQREWLFERTAAGPETRSLAGNPMAAGPQQAMRSRLVARFRRDGYEAPLDGDQWRRFPTPDFPHMADAGLLFQDPDGLEGRIAELGDYARPATVRGRAALDLLLP